MIDIINRQDKLPFGAEEEACMRRAAETALAQFEVAHPLLCLAVVDDAQIQELNRTFRALDRPTDVLSFAAREGEALASSRRGSYLGDVIVSLETAKQQACEYGHGLTRELAFLTVHGTLHLLGFDHMTKDDEREMFALQDEIMDMLGIGR